MGRVYPLAVVLVAAVFSGCAGRLPLVGNDVLGRPIHQRVDEEKYADYLAEGLVSVQESVLPGLENKTEGDYKWKMRTAVVGFGVKVEGGIGPFTVGIKPRIRAAFANGENPPIP